MNAAEVLRPFSAAQLREVLALKEKQESIDQEIDALLGSPAPSPAPVTAVRAAPAARTTPAATRPPGRPPRAAAAAAAAPPPQPGGRGKGRGDNTISLGTMMVDEIIEPSMPDGVVYKDICGVVAQWIKEGKYHTKSKEVGNLVSQSLTALKKQGLVVQPDGEKGHRPYYTVQQ